MKRAVAVLVLLLLLPSCTAEWIPSEPMDVGLHVGPGTVVESSDGAKYRIAGDAVLIPLGTFRQVMSTLEKAVELLEGDEAANQPEVLDMPAENTL